MEAGLIPVFPSPFPIRFKHMRQSVAQHHGGSFSLCPGGGGGYDLTLQRRGLPTGSNRVAVHEPVRHWGGIATEERNLTVVSVHEGPACS